VHIHNLHSPDYLIEGSTAIFDKAHVLKLNIIHESLFMQAEYTKKAAENMDVTAMQWFYIPHVLSRLTWSRPEAALSV